MSEPKMMAEWFWVDRWMGSSAFLLPMEARGVYREMLSQAWRRGARLPNDHDAIRRAIGASDKEWARAWPKIERFWRVDGYSLVNDTQLEVYVYAQGKKDRAQARAQAGAQARHQAERKQVLKHCPPSPSPSPRIIPTEIPSSPSVDSRHADGDGDAMTDLAAAVTALQAFAEFRGMAPQEILNLPRFCSRTGPLRLNGSPPEGLIRAVTGKLRAYLRLPDRKITAPPHDLGIEHEVTEADMAWDPRLGPKPEAVSA